MDIVVTTSTEDVLRYIKTNDDIICDIETTALTVGKGRILCIGFGRYKSKDVLVWWPKNLDDIEKLSMPNAVFHNAHFDQRWLRSYGAYIYTVWDTMLMAHLIDENHPVGLKDLGQRLLGYNDWSEDILNLEDLPKDQVTKYVAQDVAVTRELMKWQKKYIRTKCKPHETPESVMKSITLPAIAPLTQMEDNMMPVRMSKVASVKAKVEKELAEIDRELDASIPPKEEWPPFLQKTTPKWGNTNWTKWWLYVYQGAFCPARGKPTVTWPEGAPSLSGENLNKIDHPAAKLLIRRATLYKTLTGFLVPLEERSIDGRVPTSFKLHGTVTGRLSSSSPNKDQPGINSQQIPRDKSIRNLFGESGLAWIEADYSQLELRVAATISHEKTMLDLFRDGEDIHTYMASRVSRGAEVTKEMRTLAKGINFGFLYGMHATHFANYVREGYGIITTQKEAEAFREEYFNTFSGLPGWYRKQRKEAIEYGGVHNEFGRFRHLPKVYSEDYWVQENAFRQAINSPVQSTGSDFMLISLSRLARDLRLTKLGGKLITTVHDSVCITAPYSTARKVAKIVKETMEKADDRLHRKFLLRADVTISRYWGGEPLAEY